ncbi:MAG: glycosyltransferase family 39 protein [Verrucomicrobiales bacterium]|nr:glycosyltransferase family 39 protein [Verrucomicrobiales bacterium]
MWNGLTDQEWNRRALFLLGGVLLFRLVYAALFPVNPAGDEAYYWDWGRQLDFGYYSKPPFIAWLYAFVDWIGGGSLYAIRAAAAILGTLAAFLLFRLTSTLFDVRTGWIALLLGLAAPANSVLSFFLTIDAPLTVCWTTALWMTWRYTSGAGGRGSLVILFLALAIGHLSKQMMMIFPPMVVVFLLTEKRLRSFLKRPGLLLALFGSYLSLLPPLIWNANHDWITIHHTKHHFETGPVVENPLLERAEEFFTFLATQMGVLAPLTAIILFSVVFTQLAMFRSASRPVRFLLIFGGVPLAAMLVLALRQKLQPNWPAVFYVSCIALTAAWFSLRVRRPGWKLTRSERARKITCYLALLGGICLSAYFYFASPAFALFDAAGHRADPNRRMMGHDIMAAEFEKIRENQPDSEELFLVVMGHRDTASHLAFGLPDQPRVYRWEPSGMIVSQYEVWNTPIEDELRGKDALILMSFSPNLPEDLAQRFASTEKIGEFEADYGYDRTYYFSVHRGRDLEKWPQPKVPGK